MALITLRQGLDEARAGDYALGAFNVTDVLQAEAVLEAASATRSPVIVQTLAGSSSHTNDDAFWKLLHAVIAEYPDVPVVLHLDHGPDPVTCVRAMDAGFTSVMIDGSLDADGAPASLEANVAVTQKVVAEAHRRGVSVEGELGTIGGSEDGGASHAEIVLADPDEAERFVRETQVDALAVAIGTSHGAYKFTSPPDGSVLRMDLIEEIARRLPDTHLVMHGSSSLPPELRAVVNANGGTMPESWGVPQEEKIRSISMGIRKINQGMDSHLALTGAVRAELAGNGLLADPAPYLRAGRSAMRRLLEARMRDFREAGHAGDYPAISLPDMAGRYARTA